MSVEVLKANAAEVPPGLSTVTLFVPGDARSDAGTKANKVELSMSTVVRVDPFHCTRDAPTKPDPLITTPIEGAPEIAALGESEATAGAGEFPG